VQALSAERGLEAEPVPGAEPDLIADLGFHVVPGLDSDPGFDPDMELDPDMVLDADPGFDPGAELDDDAELDDEAELGAPPATKPLAPAVPVTTLATRRQPVFTPPPRPTGQREVSPVRKPEREWGVKEPNPSYVGPETPTELKIIVGLLFLVVIAAAVMIGMLVSDALAAVIVGVVGFLVICAFLWFSRL
jgi:hypothetical protein